MHINMATERFMCLISFLLTLTYIQTTLTLDQCDLCNPDLKDMLDSLREQIDKIEEKFFNCCPECPAGYRAVSGHCYRLSHDQLPWQQAMDSCVMQGARLADMETRDKQEALLKFVLKQTGDQAGLTYFTAGNSISGTWKWGQGQEAKEMTYSNWIQNQQENTQLSTGKGKCLEWQVDRGWDPVPCSAYRYYICEHISDTDITQNDYTDYLAAAKMNVEYLQGEGIGSDDNQDNTRSNNNQKTSNYHQNNENEENAQNGHLQQVAAPLKRTTEEPPSGTTQLTPRNHVTKPNLAKKRKSSFRSRKYKDNL